MGSIWRRLARRGTLVSVLPGVAALLLTTVLSPSAAASERSVAGQAVPGRMIVSPRPDQLIKGGEARVAFRAPAGTHRLWVRLNGRSITSRFRRSGSQRVATLSRRSGLRYGRNSLYVLAERSGRRGLVESRPFTFARRVRGLAHLEMTPGPVTKVELRVAAPRLTPAVFNSPRQLNRRLRVIRRPRRVRIELNGHPVTQAFRRPQPTSWKTSLSATHALHHGINRLRALVVEPATGRYEVLRRRFVVPHGVLLPAAGPDLARPSGLDRMLLDARDSRDGNGDTGQLNYRWEIRSKPRGSSPTLRRADTARPLFNPDRPGRYRVAVHPTDPTDPLASPSSADLADLIVPPRQLLVPFGFVPDEGTTKPPGIKVGDNFYADPDQSEDDMQWLTLDRTTLRPIKTKNTSIDPNSEQQLDTLANAVSKGGHGDLVILAQPQTGGPALSADRIDQFNSILKLLGVEPLDADTLSGRGGQQIVILGIPYGGDGSGWSSHVQYSNQPALTGFLMPDAVQAGPGIPRFRFQPEKLKFDTFDGKNDSGTLENEMQLGDQRVSAPHTGPARGGFHVVAIDPITFEPVDPANDNKTFVTNPLGSGAPANALDQRRAMTGYLNELAKRKVLVAVQSIGRTGPFAPFDSTDQQQQDLTKAWRDLTVAMQANGANPHTFYTAGPGGLDTGFDPQPTGSYAFLGGSGLKRSEMVDSSSGVETDPTTDPPVREAGTLQGFASIRSDGLMKPAIADPADKLQFQTYDIVFKSPTPWPHTDPRDPEAGAYRRALAFVSGCLPEFEGWGPDLRSAYAGNLNLNYIAAKTDLDKLNYPHRGADPGNCPAWYFSRDDPGFTSAQYGVLKEELDREFVWLDSIDRLFTAADSVLGRSGDKQLAAMKTLAENLRNAVKPSNAQVIAMRVWKYLVELAAVIATASGQEEVAAFFDFYAATLDLGSELSSEGKSENPLGDEIKAKADDLANEAVDRLNASADGLDSLRQVIISDYGRLQALGPVANTPAWTLNQATLTNQLYQAAGQWFSSAVLPVPYGVHALHESGAKGKPTTDNCYITLPAGYDFSGAPATTQLEFFGDYSVDGFSGEFPSLFVLAVHDLHSSEQAVMDETTANSIFRPDSQGGYGLQLQRFMWEAYEDVRAGAPPTNIAKCN
jgi:hypothetical protein